MTGSWLSVCLHSSSLMSHYDPAAVSLKCLRSVQLKYGFSQNCVSLLGYNTQDNPRAAAAWTRVTPAECGQGEHPHHQSSDADNNIVTSWQNFKIQIQISALHRPAQVMVKV